MVFKQLESCHICPRNCGVNRCLQSGFCGAGAELKINMADLHRGEEPPISGTKGSGTIFFSWCNLHCVYCQNHKISELGWGSNYSVEQLAKLMLSLQERGAHNINLVTPTHYSPQIAAAIQIAKTDGLYLPIVWNSSAYENVETLQSLDGLVDIYLPDLKYAHGFYAKKYSHAADYPKLAMQAICEMHNQVALLQLDSDGIATRGMIIRLLVLPGALSGTRDSLYNLAQELGTELTLSLMGQYYPAAKAADYPELNRGITAEEYQRVVDAAQEIGFNNVYVQELSCDDSWTPGFSNERVPNQVRNDNSVSK